MYAPLSHDHANTLHKISILPFLINFALNSAQAMEQKSGASEIKNDKLLSAPFELDRQF